MEKKQKSIQWLNIFLLVINISAFTTFLIMNQSEDTDNTQYNTDEYLRERLNLSDEQYEKILAMDQKVFRNYQVLIDIQCETNFELIKELSNPNPSKEVLDSLTEKIGRYHTLVKRQTVKHFENVKTICNEEQKKVLDELLLEMMEAGENCQYCNKADCARRNQLNN